MGKRIVFAVICGLGACAVLAGAARAETLVGSLHEHSGYSDGWPGSRPADYFASGKAFGLDFMGSSEHSDNLALPGAFSEECLAVPPPAECALADSVNPADSFRKWEANQEHADAASDASFTAFRGFEWTSDRFGHINVFFSDNNTNAKVDGGYVTMESFWLWLTNRPAIGGGSDGIGVFNHPDAKKLSDSDPGANWNDFEYVSAADSRMVGIEVFNDRDDFGEFYPRALDEGWHVGAVGAEDLGHRRSDDWGGPSWPKTVIDAAGRSPAAIKAAMLARDFYAVRNPAVRLSFSVDGAGMGERIDPVEGESLSVSASVSGADGTVLELVTSGGAVVATGGQTLTAARSAVPAEAYYFVRASVGGEPVAYSSPVWVEARRAGEEGPVWLAGDLHIHTCFSHDAYCPPDDDNTGPEEFYTAGLTVEERFNEASARGLDFLAITDHNDVRSSADPGFGTHGLIGVPAYENSLNGHAQMLGAEEIYDKGDGGAAAINAMAGELRADGGVFQLNHPTNDNPGPFTGCGPELDWTYGFDVRPDVVEVFNSAVASVPEAAAYWERCWLDRGERVGATGGSDSHWASLAAIQGAGTPTTWVLAKRPSLEAILDAIREGRTTISRLTPSQSAARLLLEADVDGDGEFESTIGDEVPAGSPLRVRLEGGQPATGLVRVRANGETLVDDEPLLAGGALALPAVEEPGWVRAELRFTPAGLQEVFRCGVIPVVGELPCPADQTLAAMTSPIWLGPPREGPGPEPEPGPEPPPGEPPAGDDRPRIKPRPGVRGRQGSTFFRVARLRCGSAPCRVSAPPRMGLEGGGAGLRGSVVAPGTLAAGEKAPVRVRLRRRAVARLGPTTARGSLPLRLRSTAGDVSRRVVVRFRAPARSGDRRG